MVCLLQNKEAFLFHCRLRKAPCLNSLSRTHTMFFPTFASASASSSLPCGLSPFFFLLAKLLVVQVQNQIALFLGRLPYTPKTEYMPFLCVHKASVKALTTVYLHVDLPSRLQ